MPTLEELVTSNATKEDIKDVPPLPVGTYLAMTVGPHQMVKSTQKQTPGVEFTIRLLQPRDDVDQESLQAHLSAASRTLPDVTLKHTIWDSPYAATALRDFVYETLAIEDSMPIKQALSETPGRNFLLHMKHRPFDAGGGVMRIRAEIDSTARAE